MRVMYDVQHITITLPYEGSMELKTARLTVLIDPNKKAAFERLCAQRDVTPSQVVRQLIREHLAQHGVSYLPSGQEEVPAEASAAPPEKAPSPARRSAATTARPAVARRKG
jgi:hypothetical protein